MLSYLESRDSNNVALCSVLFMKSCIQEEKERREVVHPGLGEDLNLWYSRVVVFSILTSAMVLQ